MGSVYCVDPASDPANSVQGKRFIISQRYDISIKREVREYGRMLRDEVTIMESREVDLTVVAMRETLRERGLLTGGAKAELILRINESDPRIWEELSEGRRRAAGSSGAFDMAGASPPDRESNADEKAEADDGLLEGPYDVWTGGA